MYPIYQACPIIIPHQNYREWLDAVCLNEGERLEQFIQSAKTAGEHHIGLRIFYKHHLADEKVSEIQHHIGIGIWLLLHGKLNI